MFIKFKMKIATLQGVLKFVNCEPWFWPEFARFVISRQSGHPKAASQFLVVIERLVYLETTTISVSTFSNITKATITCLMMHKN